MDCEVLVGTAGNTDPGAAVRVVFRARIAENPPPEEISEADFAVKIAGVERWEAANPMLLGHEAATGNELLAQVREWQAARRRPGPTPAGRQEAARQAAERALGPWAPFLNRPVRMPKDAGFCVLCLGTDVPREQLTDAHLLNKEEKESRPVPGCDWYDEELDVAGFLTDLTIGEGAVRVTVGMGGWGSAFAGTTVTVCRKCRRIEAEAGRKSQLQERDLKNGCNQVTISGFGPNTKSVFRKGDRIGLEIREPLDAVIATKRRYFLNVLVAAHLLAASEGSGGTSVETLRQFIIENDAGAALRAALKRDVRPRVRVFEQDGAKRFAERILTWVPAERIRRSRERRIRELCDEAEKILGEEAKTESERAQYRILSSYIRDLAGWMESLAADSANKELIPDLKQARLDRDRLCGRDFRPPEECRTALERTIGTAREAAARSAEEAVSLEQRGPTPAGPAPARDAGNGETPGGRGQYAARLEPWESEAQKTKVLAILKEYGVEKADIFGSRTTFEAAKGREKPGKESDVDFAIWWRAGERSFKKSHRLHRELEEACGRGIDLVEEPESHPNPLFVESWRMTRVPILRDRNGERQKEQAKHR